MEYDPDAEFEQAVRNKGFDDGAEFYKMVAAIDLTKPGVMEAFRAWQNEDGSKEGLAALPQRG